MALGTPDLVVLTKTASLAARNAPAQNAERKGSRERTVLEKKTVVTLRTVAERVNLAPCSVSAVLNNTPASWAIPQRTKDRVFRAAAQLKYRPNLSARSLRTKRTHMIAVLADFSQTPVARSIAGMERVLRRNGYLLVLGASDALADWTRTSVELQQRGIEGVVAMGMSVPREVEMPVVTIDLEYLTTPQPLEGETAVWLTELGESAAHMIVREIESKAAPRKTQVVPKIPATYAGLSRFDLPAPGLGIHEEVRDAS
jgi:hypothetical protein